MNIDGHIKELIMDEVHNIIDKLRGELKIQIINQNKPFLTVEDFSTLTGLKKSTIYQYCSDGKISYFRPTGKHTFFTWEAIQEFIMNEKHYMKSNSEIKRKVQTEFINNHIKLKG